MKKNLLMLLILGISTTYALQTQPNATIEDSSQKEFIASPFPGESGFIIQTESAYDLFVREDGVTFDIVPLSHYKMRDNTRPWRSPCGTISFIPEEYVAHQD